MYYNNIITVKCNLNFKITVQEENVILKIYIITIAFIVKAIYYTVNKI